MDSILTTPDFHDLFAYNFTSEEDTDPTEPRPALNTNEAIRLISMELHVTKTEEPGPNDGQSLPVVYFEGTSRSMHMQWDPNANSRIRGTVRLTKGGEVRWQTISVYGGYAYPFLSKSPINFRMLTFYLQGGEMGK
jgi:hypothetical protein